MIGRTLRTFKKIKGIEYLIDLSELEQYQNPKDRRSYLTKDKRTYKAADGHYCIYPIGRTATSYFIVCPYCGFIHIHGATKGYRMPHCRLFNIPRDYEIILA